MKSITTNKTVTLLTMFAILSTTIVAQKLDRTPPPLPKLEIGNSRGNGEVGGLDKLSTELRTLYGQFNNSTLLPDETGLTGFTSEQISGIFAVKSTTQDPLVTISIKCESLAQRESIKKAGATIIAQTGNVIYAVIPVSGLGKITDIRTVSSVEVFKALQIPSPPPEEKAPLLNLIVRGASTPSKPALANEFDKQTLTGKGVVIGIIDSGIDWQHEDFIRPDGTSRILAIWDLFDNSYESSAGSVGSKPPVYLERQSKWLGTVYTNSQINSALKGTATVNSTDKFGHGTAVTGTAAGNGRATANGVPSGTYTGVAPDADLIIVKAMECDGFSTVATLTSEWIIEYAKSLGKPVVVNMSYGGQFGSHDGTSDGEQFIDSLTGSGKPGKIITVAAGNDGRYSLHASGRFGPKRPGQADNVSSPIELYVKSPAVINGVFNTEDDWCIGFRSNNPIFAGTDDKPVPIFIFRANGVLDYQVSGTFKSPTSADLFLKSLRLSIAQTPEKTDTLQMKLPVGNYMFWGFGDGPKVKDGRFDLYSVESASSNKAFFGMGTDKTGIVSSPGNAKNAITVGSFDFRDSWINSNGEMTTYNLLVGGASSYTGSGFRRDGVVKPDISAPARYTIASLARGAKPSLGGCDGSMASGDGTHFTLDGLHVAWSGTSAATPFTAGVIALMLQKNPTLDSEQVRQILKKTAKSGGAVGAVPNQLWGWGMINPEAVLKAVPAIGGAVQKKSP